MATQYNYRNFLNQTGDFETEWIISVNNTTGSGSFGISRNNNYSGWQINNTYKSGERIWAEGRIFECTSDTSSYPFSVPLNQNYGYQGGQGNLFFKEFFNNEYKKPFFTGNGLYDEFWGPEVIDPTNLLYILDPGIRPEPFWLISNSHIGDDGLAGLYIPYITISPNWKFIANQEEDQKIYEYKLKVIFPKFVEKVTTRFSVTKREASFFGYI